MPGLRSATGRLAEAAHPCVLPARSLLQPSVLRQEEGDSLPAPVPGRVACPCACTCVCTLHSEHGLRLCIHLPHARRVTDFTGGDRPGKHAPVPEGRHADPCSQSPCDWAEEGGPETGRAWLSCPRPLGPRGSGRSRLPGDQSSRGCTRFGGEETTGRRARAPPKDSHFVPVRHGRFSSPADAYRDRDCEALLPWTPLTRSPATWAASLYQRLLLPWDALVPESLLVCGFRSGAHTLVHGPNCSTIFYANNSGLGQRWCTAQSPCANY